jgi:ATP-binding cassette, subfamily B, bacterial
MGFILDGLDTEAYDRSYSDRDLMARIYAYFHPHRWAMVLVVLGIVANSVTGSGVTIMISKTIGLVEKNPALHTMLVMTGGVLLLGALSWGFNYFRQRMSAEIIGDVVLKLRQDVFDATIRHDLSFFDEFPTGKIVSRVTSDTQDFSEVVNLTVNLVGQLMLVIFLAIWLFTINVWLTLLLLAMTPFVFVIALAFRRVARTVTQRARRSTAVINAQIQESVSGIVVAKSFRQEAAIYSTFTTNNRQAYHVGVRRGLTLNAIFPISIIASGIALGVLVYASGMAVRSSSIDSADWYLFMLTLGYFWWPMMSVASFWSQFQDGLAAAERVFALIDAEPLVKQADRQPLPRLRGEVTFDHLSFRYTEKEQVLDDFSLTIHPGETVALVGHTGAGKSSIAKLMARFYEYQSGQLLIDGRDIRTLDLGDYRRQIGLVPQEPFLFSGTLRDNIRYGRADVSDDEVLRAANHIGRGDWLRALPKGLDTDVGERGASLSMGQRQLVALARVLLKDPVIFILDEATASVDPFTEAQIQEGLELIMQDRTAIVIAHRLSTVKHADRIIVLDHGRIIEEGKHDGLLAAGGHYAELYNTYFRHQSLAYIESFGTKE